MSGPLAGKQALRLILSGRVQGVGFRYFVRGLARQLELSGRVRNLPDGRVEIAAAGEAEALARFKEEVRAGPPGARVSRLEEQELPAAPWSSFEIDH